MNRANHNTVVGNVSNRNEQAKLAQLTATKHAEQCPEVYIPRQVAMQLQHLNEVRQRLESQINIMGSKLSSVCRPIPPAAVETIPTPILVPLAEQISNECARLNELAETLDEINNAIEL